MNLKAMRARLAVLKRDGSAKVAEYNRLAASIATLEASAQAAVEAQVAALDTEISAMSEEVQSLTALIAAEEARATRNAVFGAGASIAGGRAAPRAFNEPGAATGFRTIAEFAGAVRAACIGAGALDERLAATPSQSMTTGGNAGEGFMVPPEFRDEIWELVNSGDDLLGMVDSEPTASNSVRILKDETTPWGSTGIVAKWRAEGARMDATKFATKGANVDLHELYAFTIATDDLLEDAPRLRNRISVKAAEAIRWAASESIMTGDGVGKPLGYLKSDALVVVPKETGQAAKTIVAENVANMYARLLAANLGGAVWFANSEVLPQLMTMKVGDQTIWTPPASGFAEAPGGFLLGRPVKFTEHASALGEVGDLSLADLKGYYAPTKASGITYAESIHLFFDYGMQAFRWTFRMGGQPYLSKPVTPAKGSSSKSHFVALAAR